MDLAYERRKERFLVRGPHDGQKAVLLHGLRQVHVPHGILGRDHCMLHAPHLNGGGQQDQGGKCGQMSSHAPSLEKLPRGAIHRDVRI